MTGSGPMRARMPARTIAANIEATIITGPIRATAITAPDRYYVTGNQYKGAPPRPQRAHLSRHRQSLLLPPQRRHHGPDHRRHHRRRARQFDRGRRLQDARHIARRQPRRTARPVDRSWPGDLSLGRRLSPYRPSPPGTGGAHASPVLWRRADGAASGQRRAAATWGWRASAPGPGFHCARPTPY